MAEVVEINFICKDELKLDILREFIHKEIGDCCRNESIEAMDNWDYDHSIKIDSQEISEYLFRNKIICIEEKIEDGAVGINVERLESSVYYTIWFNQKKYNNLSEYNNLINQFLLFLNQEIRSHFLLCAIGKEVIFEFQNDYINLFQKSHGIDIWINLNIELTDVIMQKYEIINWDNSIVLKNRKLDISINVESI
ncbi:MAG: hypothetical protein MJ172_09305 [Clostridia bacterium]|nr:hypothetical protein [Clostridia bacterium]